MNEKISVSAKGGEEARLLMTIPGAGYCSGLVIKGETGDIDRFASARQLCA